MKLAPRERRVAPNYILDNAESLELGKIYLGWDRKSKKRKRRQARKEPAASAAAKVMEAAAKPKAAKTAASTAKTRRPKVPIQEDRGCLPVPRVPAAAPRRAPAGRPAAAKKAGKTATPVSSGVVAAPAVEDADASDTFVTPFVRLMDGRTITVTANVHSTVADFKQQLFAMIYPGRLMDRVPSVLFNGSAHHADGATLGAAGLTSSSVIYYF